MGACLVLGFCFFVSGLAALIHVAGIVCFGACITGVLMVGCLFGFRLWFVGFLLCCFVLIAWCVTIIVCLDISC